MSTATIAEPYERQLNDDLEFAMSDASKYFDRGGKVQETLRSIVRRLDALEIDYAVVGGLALFGHGYRRFTEDVDLLVTPEDLRRIHEELSGLGYLPKFRGSKQLRDTTTGVAVEFLTSGGFPGDGKPKPVRFPAPAQASVEIDGVKYVNLPTLVDLKLASGLSNPDRMKDVSDVVELIRALRLPANFADQLDPSVAGEFRRLWDNQHASGGATFFRLHPADDAAGLADMRAAGAEVGEPDAEGFVRVTTSDPSLASQFEMEAVE